MSQDEILTTDTVKDALYTKVNNDIEELFTAVLGVVAANGSLISATDTTPAFLNGKLVADSYGLALLEVQNSGANESLAIKTDAIEFDSFFMSIL